MRPRPLLLAVVLLLPACGASEEEVQREWEATAAAARAGLMTEVEGALAGAVRRTDEAADSANDILSPMSHVARARAPGTRVTTEAVRDSLVVAGELVELEETPDLRALLEVLEDVEVSQGGLCG